MFYRFYDEEETSEAFKSLSTRYKKKGVKPAFRVQRSPDKSHNLAQLLAQEVAMGMRDEEMEVPECFEKPHFIAWGS